MFSKLLNAFRKSIIVIIPCLCLLSWSQHNGFNYKAIVKDNLGNVVANQNIDVQFQILEDATLVYQETHTPTTNSNGLVILTIGSGTTSDDFSSINWNTKNHNLNVQLDLGSGFVDLGTSPFQSVPYANNVTGLEALEVGNGSGWRLIGRDPDNYGNIGLNAIDLSLSNNSSTTKGATGNESIAMGNGTTASGIGSLATGINTTASGNDSVAMGAITTASGNESTALGFNTEAAGVRSTAMGSNTVAYSFAETVLGSYSTFYSANSVSGFNANDRLFVVGNGEDLANRSNALTILKNGTITAPSFDISEITDNKALITKEYAEANIASTGIEAIDEGNGLGWRLLGENSDDYGDIGNRAIDLSRNDFPSTTIGATGNFSTALGYSTTASGDISTTMGIGTVASGLRSIAMGDGSIASGIRSIAIGVGTTASGLRSTAMGTSSAALGSASLVAGESCVASSALEIVLGSYNTLYTPNSATEFDESDRLFVVGNGLNNTNRSNALTIYKSGLMNINDAYNLPLADGTLAGQVLTTDAAGNLSWASTSLNGTLTQDVLLNYENFDTRFNLTGTGDFIVQDASSGVFAINDSGNTTLSRTTTWKDTSIAGTTIADLSNDGNDGRFILRENGLINVDLDANTQYVFNEQGLDRDFRIEGNDINNVFHVNALTNRIGVWTDTPDSILDVEFNSTGTIAQLELTEREANDGARIRFDNSIETTNHWTLYGRADNTIADSRFNIFHPTTGNILVATGDGNVGIGRTPTTNDLEVAGTASKTTAGSWLANSDERLKTNIQTIGGETALNKLNQLRGVTYNWNDTKTGIERPENIQYGFIAQELMKVFPEKVSLDANGYYQTAYGDYDALIIEAIKELNKRIKDLELENDSLKAQLEISKSIEARLQALEDKITATNSVIKK